MSGVVHLLVSSGQGPKECGLGLARFRAPLEASAALHGLDVAWNAQGSEDAPRSVLISLAGEGAERFARSFAGVWLWRSPSPLRPTHGRGNWFLSATILPDTAASTVVDEATVRFATMRAGGPGGQHQNTTDSAVRATWACPATGRVFTALARDERSQHRNKSKALERLRAAVGAVEASEGRSTAAKVHALRASRPTGEPVAVLKGKDGRVEVWPVA